MGDLVFIALASDNTRCGGSFVILGNLPFCAHWARIRASYLLVQIALLDVKTNMFGHLGKFILQFGQVQFAIWTNTFYSMYIVQEYKIYCREIYPDYLVPLDVPTFVAIPRLYFCCHSEISQDYISPTEKEGATQLWGWETVFLQHSFLSPLGNGLAPAFHNNTLLSYFSDYLKCISLMM